MFCNTIIQHPANFVNIGRFINWDLFKPSLVREGGSTESRRMSRRLYFLAVGIIAERLINEDFYARATKTVKGWRILLIHASASHASEVCVTFPHKGRLTINQNLKFDIVEKSQLFINYSSRALENGDLL